MTSVRPAVRSYGMGTFTKRDGFSVAELLVALVVAGVLVALAAPRLAGYGDRVAVRAAVGELEGVFASARELALASRRGAAVRLDTVAGAARIESGGVRLGERPLRFVYGVRLSASRDSMAYDGRGLGYGAANLRVVAVRGGAAETLYVSRLGRVRRSGAMALP